MLSCHMCNGTGVVISYLFGHSIFIFTQVCPVTYIILPHVLSHVLSCHMCSPVTLVLSHVLSCHMCCHVTYALLSHVLSCHLCSPVTCVVLSNCRHVTTASANSAYISGPCSLFKCPSCLLHRLDLIEYIHLTPLSDLKYYARRHQVQMPLNISREDLTDLLLTRQAKELAQRTKQALRQVLGQSGNVNIADLD